MFKDDANNLTNKPGLIQITSCNGTDSRPGSNSSTTKVLANSELHVEQRNSVNGKHYKVRYEEGGCQQREMYLLSCLPLSTTPIGLRHCLRHPIYLKDLFINFQ